MQNHKSGFRNYVITYPNCSSDCRRVHRIVQKIKAHILCSCFFPPENRAVDETILKTMVKLDRPQMTI